MTDKPNITKMLMKITSIDDDSVDFIVLLDIDEEGSAYLQRRRSDKKSAGFMCIRDIVGDVAEVGDYIYHTTTIVPGTQTMNIDLVEDPLYYKRIFDDFEDDCMLDSYSSYIRDYKIEKLIKDE